MSETIKLYTVKKSGIDSYKFGGNYDPVPIGVQFLPYGYSQYPGADIWVTVDIQDGRRINEYWKIPGFDSKTPQQIVDEYFTVTTLTPDPDGKGWVSNTNQPLPSWLPTVEDGYRFGFLPIGFNWSWLGKIKTWLLIIGGLIVIDAFREKK